MCGGNEGRGPSQASGQNLKKLGFPGEGNGLTFQLCTSDCTEVSEYRDRQDRHSWG